MSVSVPNGALVEIATAYATAVPVTAITNATPAEATATQTYVAGDVVEVTSGWRQISNKAVRVGSSPTGTEFDMEGIDSTDTTRFPIGGGVGSVRKVSSFVELAQILTSSTDGGEQQFLTYQFLADDSETRIPTSKSASGMTFSVADDPTLPGYIAAAAANDDRLPRIIRITLPKGSVLLYNCYVSLNKIPSLTVNNLMAVQVTLSLLSEPVRYAS